MNSSKTPAQKIQELFLILLNQSGVKSQQALANKLGINRSRLYRWLSGQASLELQSLRAIARCLNCTVDILRQYLNGQILLEDFLALLSLVQKEDKNPSVVEIMEQLPLLAITDLDAIAGAINSLTSNYHQNTSGFARHYPTYPSLIVAEIQANGWSLNDSGLKQVAQVASIDVSRLRRIWYGFAPTETDLISLSSALTKPNGDHWTIEELIYLRSLDLFASSSTTNV
jgi:transcriptional regulator with XRE-family HTH domain